MQDNSRGEDLERRLETWAASHPGGELSPDAKKSVQDMLAASLNPVSPLPSQGRLALMFLAVFAVFSLALMAMMDKAGFHLMTGIEMASMAAILICGGVLFSLALAERMIPGSRPRLSISLLLALAGFGVARRNRPSVSMESFRRICSGGMAVRGDGSDGRHPKCCGLLVTRAARRFVCRRRPGSSAQRLGSGSGPDGSSVPVHVSTSASSTGLACCNGVNSDRAGNAHWTVATASLAVLTPDAQTPDVH